MSKSRKEYSITLRYYLRTTSEKAAEQIEMELTELIKDYLKDWTKRKDWTGASVEASVTNLESEDKT